MVGIMTSAVEAALDLYYRDIVAFAKEYILAETGEPIQLLEHQKRILCERLS